jgi:hypothetical protein
MSRIRFIEIRCPSYSVLQRVRTAQYCQPDRRLGCLCAGISKLSIPEVASHFKKFFHCVVSHKNDYKLDTTLRRIFWREKQLNIAASPGQQIKLIERSINVRRRLNPKVQIVNFVIFAAVRYRTPSRQTRNHRQGTSISACAFIDFMSHNTGDIKCHDLCTFWAMPSKYASDMLTS